MNKKKLAVIGSGISGLSASLFLSKKYDVYLLEKNNYLGGHTRTKKIICNHKEYNIDTGFIVFNEKNYPDFVKFLDYLSIDTGDTEMSFSVSINKPLFEYGGASIRALFAQPKNLFSINFFLLIYEIKKLYNHCSSLISSSNLQYENFTIDEFLNYHNYSHRIRNLHIYPMIASIWSNNFTDVEKFPFISFINFFKNHGLFNFKERPQWKYIKGGSSNYIESLMKKNLFKYYLDYKVIKVGRENNKIKIINDQNKMLEVDKVILATHADQALFLLDKPSEKERSILSKFKYGENDAYLHSDSEFMPKKDIAWSSWNFLGHSTQEKNFTLSYWMNNLQKINSDINFFVTINPSSKPNNFYDHTKFYHPVFDLETLKAQNKISNIQGNKNTYYCGSYCGYGFHEDGIQSAAYVSKLLDAELPWIRNTSFYNRLNLKN